MYHDFDYVGYEKLRKRTPDQPKKGVKPFRNIAVDTKAKRLPVASVSSPKINSPKINSPKFRQNKDNHDS